MKNYCVYLTYYTGDKLPKWYIGSTHIKNFLNGYNGSVSSKKWREIYFQEQKENKNLFKTRILTYHSNRKSALKEELRLQKMHKVVLNNNYFNESYATVNGMFGRDVSGKLNPMYKRGRTLSDEHKKNIGKSCSKEKNGMWGKTHSDETKQKIIEANKKWLQTPEGKKAKRRQAEELSKRMKNVPKSEEQRKKMSESIKKSWVNRPIRKCPNCGKEGRGADMTRHHFNNCRHKND